MYGREQRFGVAAGESRRGQRESRKSVSEERRRRGVGGQGLEARKSRGGSE